MIRQEPDDAAYRTVRVRNVEKVAYRGSARRVWYFTGSIAGRKIEAGEAVAATFQSRDD